LTITRIYEDEYHRIRTEIWSGFNSRIFLSAN